MGNFQSFVRGMWSFTTLQQLVGVESQNLWDCSSLVEIRSHWNKCLRKNRHKIVWHKSIDQLKRTIRWLNRQLLHDRRCFKEQYHHGQVFNCLQPSQMDKFQENQTKLRMNDSISIYSLDEFISFYLVVFVILEKYAVR
jgi:hypothetical protein